MASAAVGAQAPVQASRVPVDLTKAHWTPPLTPKLAFEAERNQIENVLGLRSHVLFMPQYAESMCMRTIQTLVDVIGEYPEYPVGSQRWDGRVFHPDHITNIDRPVSAFWDTPPAFLERIVFAIRLLENTAVRQVLTGVLRDEGSWRSSDIAYETTL
jgi:hypothetical protein